MDPIAVDLRLIGSVLERELRIAPGRVLMARVVSVDDAGRGTISIAGTRISASLPRQVTVGQELRLVVRELTSHRMVLSLSEQPHLPPPPPQVQLPGGGSLRVAERGPEGRDRRRPSPPGQAQTRSLTLLYDTPTLGALELHFELGPAALSVEVGAEAGRPYDRARSELEALRAALAQAVDCPVSVRVQPRQPPLDVYA